jgi:NTP pyrophosphatase (non-canonical NTP hydrolase)
MVNKAQIKKSLQRWGIRPYYLYAVEELAELIKAITKLGRREQFDVKPTKEQMFNLIDEMADVEIMISVLKQHHKITGAVENRARVKIRRMDARAKAKGRRYL